MSRRNSCIIALLTLSLPAAAQTFPANNAYVALPCGNGPMVDPAGDTANATGALDLIGDASRPAGLHAADAQFLYLRMRVAADPTQGARLLPNGWGYELDLDGDAQSYELLISVSGGGSADEVAIFRHPAAAVANSPADPAMTPAAFTYPFASHARVAAAGSNLGGGADSFIDLAVPWSDLAGLGLMRDKPVRIWAGSSTIANALDLDLACFSGAGGKLSGIDVGLAPPDPGAGGTTGTSGGTTGTSGGTTGGTGPRTLEGGPGCSVVSRGELSFGWLFLLLLSLRFVKRT